MNPRWDVLKPFEEKKDYMNDRIAHGIETNRKGYAFLTIVNEKGEAVPDAEVKITQKTHDFKYGANIFMLEEFPEKEQNEKYKKYFAETFNLATLPFYWSDLEPEQGKPRYAKDSPKIYRRPAPDLCLEFCEANGIEPKAHCLNYVYYMPQWARGSVQWEKRCLEKRFRELAERYAARIPMWEVTNETFCRWTESIYMQPDLVEWSFATAEQYFPANKLVINEASMWDDRWFHWNRSPYYMQIERAMMKGARIDSIGMQYHMMFYKDEELQKTAVPYDPERICSLLDVYATLNRPFQITELTIPSYSNDPEDEEIQAQIIRNIYSLWFSHPAMEGIIYWNLIDGFAAFCKAGDMTAGENRFYGGLLRYDFTPKPAFQTIRDLFGKEWRTNLCLHTDTGALSFKGFYGLYDLEITAGGKLVRKTIHLGKELHNRFNIVI